MNYQVKTPEFCRYYLQEGKKCSLNDKFNLLLLQAG